MVARQQRVPCTNLCRLLQHGQKHSGQCCMLCAVVATVPVAAVVALPVEMKAAAGEQMVLNLYLIYVCSLYITDYTLTEVEV